MQRTAGEMISLLEAFGLFLGVAPFWGRAFWFEFLGLYLFRCARFWFEVLGGGAFSILGVLVCGLGVVPIPQRAFACAARGRGRSIVNAPYNPRTLFK
ncbi:MAG: hypothetical protein IJ268_10085, partial [Proteobacteria bacterium]|nr:hypothetical protein [Pseudomonadota bacterium]